ncbi:MAG: HAMP domain-containing protein [Magnetospirillum sp.]|nr:HAMP domain-containing protein [Magnetospirillum sp.]
MRLTIAVKLVLLGILSAVALTVQLALTMVNERRIEAGVAYVHERLEQQKVVDAMQLDALSLVLVAMDAIVDKDERKISDARRREIDALDRRIKAGIPALKAAVDTPEEGAKATFAAERLTAILALMNTEFVPAIAVGDEARIAAFDDRIDAMGEEVQEALGVIKTSMAAEVTAALAEESAAMSASGTLSIAAFLITAAVLAALVLVLARSITNPLNAIARVVERLARGDTSVDVAGETRGDEVGTIARAVAVFKRNALDKQRMEADVAQASERAETARRDGLNQVAGAFETEVGQLVGQVTTAVGGMEGVAARMAEIASRVSGQAASVSEASQEASQSVSTVASATEELSSSFSEVASRVTETSHAARSAADEARATDATVSGLRDSVARIGEVVRIINDIASQTNLLALNATIEAARAGEAGKGFAVVANEVKNLANQTARATEEITAQIETVQTETGRVVKAIQDIGGTIDRLDGIAAGIAGAVEEQVATVREIARSVEHAAQGTERVSDTIAAVREAAEEAYIVSSDVVTAAKGLSADAAGMRHAVDGFVARVRRG